MHLTLNGCSSGTSSCVSCRQIFPAMATAFSSASLIRPSNCSNQQTRTACSSHGFPGAVRAVRQQHSTRFAAPLRYGFSGLFNRSHGPQGVWWSSQRTRRNRNGGGVARASSAVDETALDEVKVKIKVGPVRGLSERVYVFKKIFASSSIVVVSLPKPLGIEFVESPLKNAYGKNRVMVGELVSGGNADRASRVAQLFAGAPKKNAQSDVPVLNGGVMPGDILRATTTAGVYVDFFGIRRPQRVMDLYIADGRPWNLTMRALNASFVADGELTLVFERRKNPSL